MRVNVYVVKQREQENGRASDRVFEMALCFADALVGIVVIAVFLVVLWYFLLIRAIVNVRSSDHTLR